MPRPYQTQLWRLELPDTWQVRDKCGPASVTFFRPDGVGLLHVNTADELPPFQNGQGEGFRGRLAGRAFVAKYGDRFQRTWWLSCRGQCLLVTYTCSAMNAELERSEVDEILQSISEAA